MVHSVIHESEFRSLLRWQLMPILHSYKWLKQMLSGENFDAREFFLSDLQLPLGLYIF